MTSSPVSCHENLDFILFFHFVFFLATRVLLSGSVFLFLLLFLFFLLLFVLLSVAFC